MAGNGTITILYPVSGGVAVTTPDSDFDWNYYINEHLPLVGEAFGKKLISYKIIKPKKNIDDHGRFHCIATLFLKTPDDIDGELIFRCRIDIPNFTNSPYEIILGETISS